MFLCMDDRECFEPRKVGNATRRFMFSDDNLSIVARITCGKKYTTRLCRYAIATHGGVLLGCGSTQRNTCTRKMSLSHHRFGHIRQRRARTKSTGRRECSRASRVSMQRTSRLVEPEGATSLVLRTTLYPRKPRKRDAETS